MFDNSAYATGWDIDTPDTTAGFSVNSCGHYRLMNRARLDTSRPGGRRDYQLLYVAQGRAHFVLHGVDNAVEQGGIVLYRPGEAQNFYYLLGEAPDVYWLHFTGWEVESFLHALGFDGTQPRNAALSPQYPKLFDAVIRELLLKQPHDGCMAQLLARQLLVLLARGMQEKAAQGERLTEQISQAVHLMHYSYHLPLSTQEYARRLNMSECWFIRCFKRCMGVTPLQFLTDIRMNQAAILLESAPYRIGEIAAMVGYENQLYFSRQFRKKLGVSPQQYRARFAADGQRDGI